MLKKAIGFLFFVMCALFCTCSDNSNPTYPFERSVLDVSIAKKCLNGSSAPGSECYLMRWQHPIEKKDLQSYYIWIDTTIVKYSDQSVSQSQINLATAERAYSGKGDGDSLDLTNYLTEDLKKRDSLHIAIWAKYSGNEQGAIYHFYTYFGDDIPPSVVNFSDSASADTIWLSFMRPTDQRDFYSPDSINGPIAGYNVSIQAVNSSENIRDVALTVRLAGNLVGSSVRRMYKFRKDWRSVSLEAETSTRQNYFIFAIIDGRGFVNDNTQANNWEVRISGLKPEHSYDVSIVAFDSAGNSSSTNRRIKTTDSIPPLIANKFWLYADSTDGLPKLDSNRLVLFWPSSVDPLSKTTQIQLDSTLVIPASCRQGTCYREVENYSVEQKNIENAWEPINRISSIPSGYYNTRYKPNENGSMVAYSGSDINGTFVSDTLRWILPGDSIFLRIRAIDSSGHYSNAWINTIIVSKGELGSYECPPNFVPVKEDSSIFCMEKLQHTVENKLKEFEKNILYTEAKETCESLGKTNDFNKFNVSLCSERQWSAACNSKGSSYGTIEETDFSPDRFLYMYCGVGTADSISAKDINKRNKICASPDGVRDLPGQLQEWVIDSDNNTPLLKGSSYANFEGASRVELALCKNRFTPTRIRPRYTTDTVFLYVSGYRIDTLQTRDTSRTPYAILLPGSLKDTILTYTIRSLKSNEILSVDYVNNAEYRKRGGKIWLDELWRGLKYEPKDTLNALILKGDSIVDASNFFLDPSVGFRCCATNKN